MLADLGYGPSSKLPVFGPFKISVNHHFEGRGDSNQAAVEEVMKICSQNYAVSETMAAVAGNRKNVGCLQRLPDSAARDRTLVVVHHK